MKVRLTFECTRCGSKFFRPSTKWAFRDTLLRKIGVTPQRCFQCRRRFYMFYPVALYLFLRALASPAVAEHERKLSRPAKLPHAVPHPAVKAVKTDVVWSTFAEADQSDTRH